MRLLPVDRDGIRAVCNLNDASVIFKEVSIGSTKRYYCTIKTKYTERSGIQIFYKESKITPKKENYYIMICDKGQYLFISGVDLCNKGINYYRNLTPGSEEFKNKELIQWLRG